MRGLKVFKFVDKLTHFVYRGFRLIGPPVDRISRLIWPPVDRISRLIWPPDDRISRLIGPPVDRISRLIWPNCEERNPIKDNAQYYIRLIRPLFCLIGP